MDFFIPQKFFRILVWLGLYSRLIGAASTAESLKNANNSAKQRQNGNGPRTSLLVPGGAVY